MRLLNAQNLKTKPNETRTSSNRNHRSDASLLFTRQSYDMLTAIGYILLTFLIVVYVTIMLQIWKHNRDAKTEWQQYWDDVFNNQK